MEQSASGRISSRPTEEPSTGGSSSLRPVGRIGADRLTQSKSPSALITERIEELGDWRGDTLAHVRKLIKEADPKITEEWKWRGVPVWSDSGIVCTGESYKTHVKLTFAKGASIKDPKGIFNSSLDGNARRAIDLHEGDKINEAAFKELIRAAVELNTKGKK